MIASRNIIGCVALAMAALGCPDGTHGVAPAGEAAPPRASACPSSPQAVETTPGTALHHRQAETWIEQLGAAADLVLLDADAIAAANLATTEIEGAWRDPSSPGVGDSASTSASLVERAAWLRAEVAAARLEEHERGALAAAETLALSASAVDHERVVVEETPMFCVPLASGLYKSPADPDFDRNRCASLHPGERVRVLRRASEGQWLYAHAGHTAGWVQPGGLTRRLSRDELDTWTGRRRLVPVRDDAKTVDGFPLRLGTSVPVLGQTPAGFRVIVPAADGLRETLVAPDQPVSEGFPAFTRANVLRAAFSELGAPYGWGGRAGERDCSRYLRDLFATFGLELARHSGVQAQLGTTNLDVEAMAQAEKLATIRQHAARGVVLLYMPGHIMLYLGQAGADDYAISSMSEFLVPCPGGSDSVYRLDRVAVTTLEIGRGSERTAFIERITRVVVFAPSMLETAASAAG